MQFISCVALCCTAVTLVHWAGAARHGLHDHNSSGAQRGAVIHANGTLVTEAATASPGEVVSVFLTGLGRPDGDISAGLPAPASPLISARGPIEAVIGAVSVTPSYAGLTPGFAGLYQANVQVPATLAEGSYGLRIVARGVMSNTVNLAVRR